MAKKLFNYFVNNNNKGMHAVPQAYWIHTVLSTSV